jgi:hypothetical protein
MIECSVISNMILYGGYNNCARSLAMAAVIILPHKALNPLTENYHHSMGMVITTHTHS